jgi:hypothetical protein
MRKIVVLSTIGGFVLGLLLSICAVAFQSYRIEIPIGQFSQQNWLVAIAICGILVAMGTVLGILLGLVGGLVVRLSRRTH